MTKLEHYQTQRDFKPTKVRLEILADARKDFDQLQYEIEQLDRATDAQDHLEARSAFEDQYCDLVSNIKDIIEKATASPVPAGILTPLSNRSVNDNININLPVLHLKTFSGNYKDWLNFENSFKSVIDETKTLNKRQCFQYLKSSLRDEALRAIDSLTINEDNYGKAWEILENRFKNTRLIVQDHVSTIMNAPNLSKASHLMLRKLLDTVTSNIASLKMLNIPVDHWDALIIPIIVEKLDYTTKRDWQTSLDKSVPKYTEFIKYLEKRCVVLESLATTHTNKANTSNTNQSVKYHNQNQRPKFQTVTHAATYNKTYLCLYCKNTSHSISQCDTFVKLNVAEKLTQVQKLKLCTNCLRNNHFVTNCRSKSRCRTCGETHHTFLHQIDDSNKKSETSLNLHTNMTKANAVLLSTAIILIKNSKNEYQPCRAFLDQGSMANYITHSMCQKLNLKSNPTNVEIKCLNGSTSSTNKQTSIVIKSNYNSFSANLECLIVDRITENIPLTAINPDSLEIPKNLNLADPTFYEPDTVHLLIGAGLFWSLLCVGQVTTPSGLVFHKTHLGFIAGGTYVNSQANSQTSCLFTTNTNSNDRLEKQVSNFFEIENINNNNDAKNLTIEELECENHFRKNMRRDSSGRFIIKLPIKNNKINIGETKKLALKRFYSLERKLDKNSALKSNYSKFISEYLELNHMEPVTGLSDDNNSVYLPHHAVFKESSDTTKLRVVFDASLISSNGRSLNDNLMCGPVIQSELFDILLRFRTHKYTLSGDITKMYRQIQVHQQHTDLQLIVWREQSDEPIKTFRLTSLTYGTKPASFLATRCLIELADQNEIKYSRASDIIRNDFYMDDLLTGTETISDLIDIKNQVADILNQGCFELRKFQSNCKDVLPVNEQQHKETNVNLSKTELSKILGLYWDSNNDILKFEIELNSLANKVTKRTILSITAQIFDPLGLIGPIIMKFKIILQQLWSLKISWDEAVPTHIHTTWKLLLDQLHNIKLIQIPRRIIACCPTNRIELHGFCDASLQGYGAVIYIRTLNSEGTFESRLLCSKSRVAPLKTITLPRLELCGALLLARLYQKARQAIKLIISHEFFWTDSSIVLAWISTPPSSLKVFVANRISEINSLTDVNSWHHVKSEFNAADILSRGASPSDFIKNDSWFFGPNFLKTDQSLWAPSAIKIRSEIPEIRIAAPTTTQIQELPVLTKYSSFNRLQRIFAWILRFINRIKTKNAVKLQGNLSTDELNNSAQKIISLIQKSVFAAELKNLSNNKPLQFKINVFESVYRR